MIILVRQRVEPLTSVSAALAALLGAGVAKTFAMPGAPGVQDSSRPNYPDPFRIPPAQAIQVDCDDDKAGYAKAGFYAAGFEVPTATGAAHDPGANDAVTLAVTHANPDNLQDYPLGIGQCAILAAKALCGAYVTRPIAPNDDPYIGDDPDTSIQVSCNSADVQRVKGGFAAAHFNAAQE